MPGRNPPTRVVVRRSMNDHGSMIVEVCDTNETRHVCEYATPEVRRRLEALSPGTTLRLRMSRVGIRSNVWRVFAVSNSRSAGGSADGDTPAQQRL